MKHSIAADWESFSKAVLDPIHAPAVQREEMRKAFYAGAATMFTLVNEAAVDPDEDVCVQHMKVLSQELDAFAQSLRAQGHTPVGRA